MARSNSYVISVDSFDGHDQEDVTRENAQNITGSFLCLFSFFFRSKILCGIVGAPLINMQVYVPPLVI